MRYFFTALFRLNVTTSGSLTVWLHDFKRFSTSPFLWTSLLPSHPPLSCGFALEGHWEYSSLICLFAAVHLVQNHSVVLCTDHCLFLQPFIFHPVRYFLWHLSVHKTWIIRAAIKLCQCSPSTRTFYIISATSNDTSLSMLRPNVSAFLHWSIWCFQYRMMKEEQMSTCMDTNTHTQMHINRICANSLSLSLSLSIYIYIYIYIYRERESLFSVLSIMHLIPEVGK
jgi:hypothetical protein